MALLDAIEASAAKLDNVKDSVIAALGTLSGEVQTLTNELATAGVDPVIVAKAQELANGINADADAIAAAVTANTPAAPPAAPPPAEEPPPAA